MAHDPMRPIRDAADPARTRGLSLLLGARRDDAVLTFRLLVRLSQGERRAGDNAA